MRRQEKGSDEANELYIDNVGDLQHACSLGLVLVGLHNIVSPKAVVCLLEYRREGVEVSRWGG